AVAELERALEVGAPDRVRLVAAQERRRVRRRGAPRPPGPREPVPLEDRAHRARRGERQPGIALRQDNHELSGAPCRMLLTGRDQDGHDLIGDRVGVATGGTAPIPQVRAPVGLEAAPPLVAGLPADLVLAAELAHRQLAAQTLDNEPRSFVHRADLLPRHGHLPAMPCNPSARSALLPMCPVCTTGPTPQLASLGRALRARRIYLQSSVTLLPRHRPDAH